MKRFCLKILAGALLMVCAPTVQIKAYESSDCCRPTCCYECSCNPLYCGAWDVQVHTGVEPIVWTDRGNISLVQCVPTPAANPINILFEIPKFSSFHKTPWVIGGQLGYHHSDNVRLYAEFDYVQASAKNDVEIQTFNGSNSFVFNLQKYRLFEAYVGARYYWDRWCDRVSFYLGVKAGLVHHKRSRYSATITPPVPAVLFADDVTLFNRNTLPSGGIDFGLDICICGCWSLVIGAGVIASCGPDSESLNFTSNNGCVLTTTVPGINGLLVGHIGTELRFPVTIGLRYSF